MVSKYLISVIIPMYNAEKYIEECLDSIINQTLGNKNIQIIVVNDSSTDSSKEIIEEYITKYKNIKLVNLEKCSQMAGKPRNVGIQYAESEYIMFLDADDFLNIDACEFMYDNILKTNADLVIGNIQYANQGGENLSEREFMNSKNMLITYNGNNFEEFYPNMNSSCCNKIFKKYIIDNYNLKFLEGLPAEDQYFSYSYFLKSKKVCMVNDIVYYYRINNNSFSNKRYKSFFDKSNIAYKEVYKLFEKDNKIDWYSYIYPSTLMYMAYSFIDSDEMNDIEREDVLKNMHWLYEKIKTFNINIYTEKLNEFVDNIINKNYDIAIKIGKDIARERKCMNINERKRMSIPEENIKTSVN